MSGRRASCLCLVVAIIALIPRWSAAWTDPSGHRTVFVPVTRDVTIEVLDWGGRGPTILLLAGGGNTAHVFDHFAEQFTDRFRVVALTRRGYGASSRPSDGYDLQTLMRDIIAVLDRLGVERPIVIGHSRAGAEMTRLAASHPDRVSALVYLDAAFDRSKPPQAPAPERRVAENDLTSVENFNAWMARTRGMRYPEAEIRAIRQVDANGRVRGPTTPPNVNVAISAAADERPEYSKVRAPALAIYSPVTIHSLYPDYESLAPQDKALADTRASEAQRLREESVEQFRSEMKRRQVVMLNSGVHHVFLSNESEVVSLVRGFLRELRLR
jgi:pimeloyl-ACP methyl ester carboxylesterase